MTHDDKTPDMAALGPLQGIRLDPRSTRPQYQQVAEQLQHLLVTRQIGSGWGLPPERVLAESLGTSRTVVKRAYDTLRQQGVLDSNGRAGTQVRQLPQVQPEMGRLKGFTQEMRELGITASTRLESLGIVQCRTMASLFKRPSGARFLHTVRVRLGDDVPMTRECAWYDLSLAPALAQWNGDGSAYNYLQDRCGVQLDWADQTIEAISSANAERQAFGFEDPQPCLLLKRSTYSTRGELVEYVEGVFRGDLYTYRLKLKV